MKKYPRITWDDLPHKFKDMCVVKARIVRIEFASEGVSGLQIANPEKNLELLKAGPIFHLDFILSIQEEEAKKEKDQSTLPKELITEKDQSTLPKGLITEIVKTKLCIYECGWGYSGIEGEEKIILPVTNYPYLPYSEGDLVLCLYDPHKTDKDNNEIPIGKRLILIGHADEMVEREETDLKVFPYSCGNWELLPLVPRLEEIKSDEGSTSNTESNEERALKIKLPASIKIEKKRKLGYAQISSKGKEDTLIWYNATDTKVFSENRYKSKGLSYFKWPFGYVDSYRISTDAFANWDAEVRPWNGVLSYPPDGVYFLSPIPPNRIWEKLAVDVANPRAWDFIGREQPYSAYAENPDTESFDRYGQDKDWPYPSVLRNYINVKRRNQFDISYTGGEYTAIVLLFYPYPRSRIQKVIDSEGEKSWIIISAWAQTQNYIYEGISGDGSAGELTGYWVLGTEGVTERGANAFIRLRPMCKMKENVFENIDAFLIDAEDRVQINKTNVVIPKSIVTERVKIEEVKNFNSLPVNVWQNSRENLVTSSIDLPVEYTWVKEMPPYSSGERHTLTELTVPKYTFLDGATASIYTREWKKYVLVDGVERLMESEFESIVTVTIDEDLEITVKNDNPLLLNTVNLIEYPFTDKRILNKYTKPILTATSLTGKVHDLSWYISNAARANLTYPPQVAKSELIYPDGERIELLRVFGNENVEVTLNDLPQGTLVELEYSEFNPDVCEINPISDGNLIIMGLKRYKKQIIVNQRKIIFSATTFIGSYETPLIYISYTDALTDDLQAVISQIVEQIRSNI